MDKPATLVDKLRTWAARTPERPALYWRADGQLRHLTWRAYERAARAVGRGLTALGLSPGDSVAIIARNRPEWLIAQQGIMAAGGLPNPAYTTHGADLIE